ncbi:MAG TPA: isoprenylcysteine carboxylmethyltransferase family protein [Vicinamibacterales bacterium]|nr:isoprenylcysteine carboxylmethyltransferase family protein [Vicinamibacterales bacterium]
MLLDDTFQRILLISFVVVLPIALYYRIKSQATREKLDRRQEGLFILATLRPVGLLLWVGIFAYTINPKRMAWSAVPLPDGLRWSGVAVLGVAAALLLWTLHSLGPNLTDTVVTRQAHTLVTRGPYRWVRHPFYDSAGLMVLGVALMAANWFLMLGGLVFMILIVIRTRTEEDKLLARFGDSYRTYMMQTGRFLPHVSPGGVRSWPDTTP